MLRLSREIDSGAAGSQEGPTAKATTTARASYEMPGEMRDADHEAKEDEETGNDDDDSTMVIWRSKKNTNNNMMLMVMMMMMMMMMLMMLMMLMTMMMTMILEGSVFAARGQLRASPS